MEKIVVGTDFSEPSNLAVSQAMQVARHVGAEVVLVHAGTIAEYSEDDFGSHQEKMNGWAEKIFTQHREELEEFRERLSGQGVDVSQAYHEGLPAESLCRATEELGADLLVVGTHGFSGVSRFLLGNVADEIVRISSGNVLVSRSDAGVGGFERILVPLDLEGDPAKVIEMALKLAGNDAEIELFHCWHLPSGFASSLRPKRMAVLQEIRDSKLASVNEKLARLTRQYDRGEIRLSVAQSETSARDGICQRLDAGEYDLVVVGSRVRTGLNRWWIGNVAASTMRHASCSALIVKEGE